MAASIILDDSLPQENLQPGFCRPVWNRERKMKCKRCRAHVANDADVCPLCGQDLTALRQLLRDFYEETPPQGEAEAQIPGSGGQKTFEPDAEIGKFARPEPRIILRGEGPIIDFSGAEEAQVEEAEGEAPSSAETVAPNGGFLLRGLAFLTDQLVLLFILTIFITAGFAGLGFGSAAGGREISFFKQARVLVPALLPLTFVLGLTYFSFFHAAWGQTIGKMIFGLRVIQTDGESLSFCRGLARSCAYILSAIPFGVGFLWVALSAEKKGWHDLILGTRVVRV
jgi:uncharacterized RDD family membrane protein YckC